MEYFFLLFVGWFDKTDGSTYLFIALRTFRTGLAVICYSITLFFFVGATSYSIGTMVAMFLRRTRGRISRKIELWLIVRDFKASHPDEPSNHSKQPAGITQLDEPSPSNQSLADGQALQRSRWSAVPQAFDLADVTKHWVPRMSEGQTSSFNGLDMLETFTNRLQPNEIKASTTAGSALDISYNFVDPVTSKNAGHVYGIANNLNSSRSQTFTYDQLNRVISAGTTATTGNYCWGYQYSYDAWGNLLSQAGWTPTYNACTETQMGAVTADGNNHIFPPSSYDAAGNTLSDGNYSYTWNGDSEMKTAAGVTYSYDGDGRRAAKVGSKLYWYGSGGEILAESDAAGNVLNEYTFFGGKRIAMVPATGNTLLYAEDFLGSSRVVMQLSGSTATLCYDADFPPYGQERPYTNTCTQNNYKFEGKERDSETQNDEFGARNYSWRFGRWLSADWSAVPVPVPYANLTNPQTLNLYSMVADDPESFADLDGHYNGAYRHHCPGDCEDPTTEWNAGIEALTCDPNVHADCGETAAQAAAEEAEIQAQEAAARTSNQQAGQAQNQETPQSLRDQIPSVTRAAMAMAIADSDSARGNDPTGGFHEESGVAGQVSGGAWIVSRDKPGPYANPDVEEHAHNTPVAAHQEVANLIVNPMVFFHVHPSGQTATHNWKQPPQSKDLREAVSGKINIVFGAHDHKVYFYNSSGVIGKPMKVKDFLGQ